MTMKESEEHIKRLNGTTVARNPSLSMRESLKESRKESKTLLNTEGKMRFFEDQGPFTWFMKDLQ